MSSHSSSSPLRLEAAPEGAGPPTDAIRLTYEQRLRTRLAAHLESGTEVTLVRPRGTTLRIGERLIAADGRIVEVLAAPEALLEVHTSDPVLLARAAYHLGNRHVAVEVRAQSLRTVRDPVLAPLLARLGLAPSAIDAPFDPEGGAYGHSHALAPERGAAPIIHEFRGP